MRSVIDIRYVVEQGFSPEVVNVFTETSRAAATLRKLMDERDLERAARKQARELEKLRMAA
jgi:hypothetical protein